MSLLICVDNGWQACAVGSHLLAGYGNMSYRKMLPLLRQSRIAYLSIKDYITWAKEVHTVIRKTGCDWLGKKLDNDDRVGM